MITDLRDLESLLSQHDPGLILVGPVRSLSSSGYSYFDIAARGSRVYEAIGLGFFEDEVDAESQRANTIALLKSHFKEMLTFDSHYQMARAVNTRWPNEETIRILTSATEEAIEVLASTALDAPTRDGSIDEKSRVHVTADDSGQQPADDATREPVVVRAPSRPGTADRPATREHDFGFDQDDLASAIFRALHRAQPANVTSSNPPPGADDHPVTPHSGRSDEDIAAVVKALGPSHQSQTAPKLPAAATTALKGDPVVEEQRGNCGLDQCDVEISRAMPASQRQRVPSLRIERAGYLASITLLVCAVGGASALLTWAIVRSNTPYMARDVGTTSTLRPNVATAPSSSLTQQTAPIKPTKIEAEPQAITNELPLQTEPAPAVVVPSPPAPQPSGGEGTQAQTVLDSQREHQTMVAPASGPEPSPGLPQQTEPASAVVAPSPPAPQPSAGEGTQAQTVPDSQREHQTMTAPASGPQPSPEQGSGSPLRVDPQEVTTLIDRSSAYLKRGDLASARLLLRRAVAAGSAEAALMLGSTFDPLVIRQLGVIGIEPDIARARQWYETAAELGSDVAAQRLAKLKNQ